MEILNIISLKYCGPGVLYEMRNLTGEKALVPPSIFISELQMSTEERFEKIKIFESRKLRPSAGLNISPNCIIFQNYTVGKIYHVPVSVINSGKNPCGVHLFMTDSPYVKLIIDSPLPSKLAPGIEIKCTVQFSPQFSGDYIHYLQITSPESRYSIKILAIGPRPMLTFPDNIILKDSPVDIGTEKNFLVKNIGRVSGSFRIIFGPNFSVTPEDGIIEPDTTINFVIKFCAKEEGVFKDYFTLRFDSGEQLQIGVEATAKSSTIVLSKSKILFEETYLGLKCQKTVEIQNCSNHVVRFAWKKFNSKELDKIEGDKMKEGFEIIKDLESRKNAKLEQFDIIEKDIADVIYDRIYKDELIDFKNSQQFLYNDQHFSIIPLTGEIYPNHRIEVNLIFSPQVVDDLSSIAYCEVTAKFDRLPLKLMGCGIGPKLKCSIDTIDLKDIFLFAEVPFQVVFTNYGDIPAEILFSPKSSFFDVNVKCLPTSLYFKPFEHAAFTLYFTCTKAGHFIEDMHFIIKESGEMMKFFVKGHGVYARLLVDGNMDFGFLAIGIQEERELIVQNLASIDIPYSFSIKQGSTTPVNLYAVKSITPGSILPAAPKEYSILPMEGICKANESVKILIRLTPNSLGNKENVLWLETWCSASHRIPVKITHICCLPDIVCKPSDVNIRFSFLNYLCQRIINIRNTSDIAGYIWLYIDENHGLQVSTNVSEFFIDAYENIDVSMNIICTDLGKQQAILKYCLFGGEEEIACNIECIGQGPVVQLLPEILNFGDVNLVETSTRSLSIFNDSPTEAEMEITVKNPKFWSVSKKVLQLEPEATEQIDVSCYLNDTVNFSSVLACNVKNRGVLQCQLRAKGVGSSIIVTPKITGVCDFGPQLTKILITKKFLLQNCGIRHHRIIVSTQKIIKNFQSYDPDAVHSRLKFEPAMFSLKPKDQIELVVTTKNRKKELVLEEWFFHAIIEKIEQKQIIFETLFTINFVDPTLSISKKVMNFRSDLTAEKDTCINVDMVQIINMSPMPLRMDVIVKSPFFMLVDEQKVYKFILELGRDESFYLTVYFDSSSEEKYCFVVQKKLHIKFHNHPHEEIIKLRGEVNYPNISFQPNEIDFMLSSPASSTAKYIELTNLSPLRFNYYFEWYGKYISLTNVCQPRPQPRVAPSVEILSGSSDLSLSIEPEAAIATPKHSMKKKGGKVEKNKEKPERKAKKGKSPSEDSKTKKPREGLFAHYYIETPVVYNYVQIFEELHEVHTVDSLIGLTERNVDNLRLMKQNLFASVRDYQNKENYELLSCVTQLKEIAEPINQMMEVVPFSGTLEPFETQIVTLTYLPFRYESFTSKLICHIAGGPEEYLDITGTCTDVNYELESTQIDFGRQIFNEMSAKNLYLKNTGLKAFTFTIKNKELDMSQSTRLLEVGWFEVFPKFQVIHPGECTCIIVKYTPGISRKFVETFEIELENLEMITVTVTGYGVFPQVYLSLPRLGISNSENLELCYNAIANLTEDFLSHVETLKDWNNPEGEFFPFDFPNPTKKKLRKSGWVIVTYHRKYPSRMDIDLAIERYLACSHIVKTHSQILDNPTFIRSKNHPLLTTPPYVLDFNCVHIEGAVHHTVNILNYGPTKAKIRISPLIKKSGFFEAGFNLQLNKRVIQVGESEPLHIIFYPTGEYYTEREKKVNVTIYLDVTHGPRIPIQISALVTKPFMSANKTFVHFHSVALGTCKVMNIILKNGSRLPVLWEATIFHPKCLMHPKINKHKFFYLNENSGRIEPQELYILDINFEPTDSVHYDWRLKIAMERSDEQIIVTLKGDGYSHELKIEKKELCFKPCLPYETNSAVIFTVENTSPDAVEYFFPDFDKQILEEEAILNLICQYYNSDKIFIPQRFPGEKLPYAFNEFVENLRHELIQSLMYNHDDPPPPMPTVSSFKVKKIKKKKAAEFSQSSKSSGNSDPLINKSSQEINAMLKEFLQTKMDLQFEDKTSIDITSFKTIDPIQIAFIDSKGPSGYLDSSDDNDGTLIICHGAPYTEYLHAANRLARKLNLPIYTIDDLIIETLVYSGSLTSIKINEIINDAFETFHGVLPEPPEENPLKLLQHKLTFLQNTGVGRSSKKGSNKNSAKASKSSKSADAKKIGSAGPTFLNIPQELLLDLLKQKFAEFRIGIVIESLENTFINVPILTLFTLLQASNGMKNVSGVFTYKSMQQYHDHQELLRLEEFINTENKKIEMLEYFDEISDTEMDNLSPELLNLYKKEYVAVRKENTAKRLEALRIKKIIKQAKYKAKKQGAPKTKSQVTLFNAKSKKSIPSKLSKKSSEKTISSKAPKKAKHVDKQHQQLEAKIAKEFDVFTNLYLEAMHIFEYWDKRYGIVTKEYVPKKVHSPSKAKKTKDSEKASKKTVKSARVSVCFQTFETVTADPNIGIPLWIVTESDDIFRDYEIISSELKRLIQYATGQTEDKIILESETFSIINNPPIRENFETSPVFSLLNSHSDSTLPFSISLDEEQPDSKIEIELANSMSFAKLVKRKKRKSVTKTSAAKTSRASAEIKPISDYFDTRTILEPGQVRHYQLKFKPTEIGHYEFIYRIEITGMNKFYQVKCVGDCDLPRIDMSPKSLYPACVVNNLNFSSNVYVKSTGMFDFGNTLLCRGSIGDISSYSKQGYIHLKNISTLPCELLVNLISKTEMFHACREMMQISPGRIETLMMRACPEMLGINRDLLAISIKHNPRVEIIPLQCEGCILKFEVIPKKITFERVILNTPTIKHLLLLNQSLITVYWQFSNTDNQFFMSPSNGILKPLSNKEVAIEYPALVTEVVSNKKIHLEIFREMGEHTPLLKEIIDISAETCDLALKCEKHINFGEIKAKKEYSYNYVITNDGKYNVLFEFTKINYSDIDPRKQNIVNMFKMSQTTGVLTHGKLSHLILRFNCSIIINIKEFPIFKCNIMDDVTRKVISQFGLAVTMKTNFSKFDIYPIPDINFGPLLVKTESSQKIVITNKGTLEFSYHVLCKRTLDLLQAKAAKKAASKGSIKTKSLKSSKKSSSKKSSKTAGGSGGKKPKKSKDSGDSTESKKKGSKKSKEKGSKKSKEKGSKKSKEDSKKSKDKESKKSKDTNKTKGSKKGNKAKAVKPGPPITCGIFTVKNSKNIIRPGEKAELEVICHSTTVGIHDELLIVFVSETGPQDRMGKLINLKATPCLPSLDFNNVENIFKEQFIVHKISDFEMPAEIGDHCVFITSSGILQFNNVCLNTTASTNLQLYNDGLIDAEVSVNCTSPNNVFTVPIKSLFVLSYCAASVRVEFTPTELAKFSGTLEIKIIMPVGFKDEEKVFDLSGKGTVPEITLINPQEHDNMNTSEIVLDPTLITTFSTTPISFENTGLYPCTVIVEVFEDFRYAFSLNIMSDSMKFLHCPEAHATDHFKKIKFSPGNIANFELVFRPEELDNYYSCTVKIHIINNPFEIFTLIIQASCFTEDVVLLELPTSIANHPNSVSELSLPNMCGINYHLNFGAIFLNTLHKKRFKIWNKSEDSTYKFAFRSPLPDMKYIPSVGHLAPGTSKDIFVTYLSQDPTEIVELLLDCIIGQIVYTNPPKSDISWDDRQALLIWGDSVQITDNQSYDVLYNREPAPEIILEKQETPKIFEGNLEPEYELLKDSIRRIPILFSALSNYSKYQCNVNNIDLPETFIYEETIYKFDVINTGEVNLEINWNIKEENFSNLNIQFVKQPPKDSYNRIRDRKARPLTGNEKFIEHHISASRTTILSETPLMPFKIVPSNITIPPKSIKEISLHFCPTEIYDFHAKIQASMENLSPELRNISIHVRAQSLTTSCHFDVEFTDYITSGRRKSHTCDTMDINSTTKVVEFGCLGPGIQHDHSFNIINPTEEDLHYTWRQIRSYEISSVPLFSCKQEKGLILKMKQEPATFSVFPQKTGLFEALYNFRIEKYNIDIPLLLVARVREAKVNFTVSNIYLRPTVLGIPTHDTVTLKNNEDVDIEFKIKKNSLYSEGRRQFVTVQPRKGFLKRKSETKLAINFDPTDVGNESFLLKCRIDFAQSPLSLGITTKCYAVEVLVSCLIAGRKIILSHEDDNILDLGEVLPHHEEEIIFYVRNQGKIGFYYYWKYNDDYIDRKFHIKLNTLEGYVKRNSEIPMKFNVTALRKAVMKNFRLDLQVRYGPEYKILVNAAVTTADYKFSFLEFDFGPCFIQNSSICYYHKALEFCNQGTIPIILELTFFNTEYLTVDFKMKTIPPKTKDSINICFHPKKMQKYKNQLIFTINAQKTIVIITGEGINLNLALVNIADKTVDLGSPAVGKTVIKVVKVLNKSHATVNAIFDIYYRLPIVMEPTPPNTHYLKPHKKEKIIEEYLEPPKSEKKKSKKNAKNKSDKSSSKKSKATKKSDNTKKIINKIKKAKSAKSKSSNKKRRDSAKKSIKSSLFKEPVTVEEEEPPESKMITITPKTAVTIFPNKISEFTITYTPSQKVQPFNNLVSVQVLEMVQPLCIIKGSCTGPSFFLDRQQISFGVVVQYCSRKLKVILYNEGDVSSRFHWECDNKDDFEFSPMQGYSAAGIPTSIVVEFHPTHLNTQSRLNAYLILEAINHPLSVSLLGLCATIPDAIQVIHFECSVRTSATDTITVFNNSMQPWKLYPQLNSDCFSCTHMIKVPAKGNTVCDLVYSPIHMTKKDPHKATLFIKIPDGQALVYDLEGRARRPEPIKSLYLEVHCKSLHKEVFPVYNWSRSKQNFKVYTEDITTNSEDILYEIRGQESLEVMGTNTRNYEWFFYPYKEGCVELRVIFMNDEKEYLFYEVLIKVMKCKIFEIIDLSNCIRCPKIHKLLLTNPTDRVITYKLSCNSVLLSFTNTVSVPAHSELYENIEFLPVLYEESTATLEAHCTELGSYLFEFKLKGLPAIPEQPIVFQVELGYKKTINVLLKNFTKTRTIYNNKIENGSSAFNIPKAVNLHQTMNVPLTFFPHEIGRIETTLECLSSTAGDYEFPIVGICLAPKPKGPFLVKVNSSVFIEFTNPFITDEVFDLFIKPRAFVLMSKQETIKARSTIKIMVKLINVESTGKITGKLVICPAIYEKIKWIYYLGEE